MFNKIILIGNLTRDIELKYTSSGTALAKTAIATTRKFSKDGERKEEVCFVDITFFGRSAEIANQYLRRGSKCLVEGHLMFEQWTDQQGQKRSKHGVTVESMQMLDSKADAQNLGGKSDDSQSYKEPSGMTPSFGQNQQGYGVEQGQQAPQQQSPNNGQAKQDKTPKQQQMMPEYEIDEDEIPF